MSLYSKRGVSAQKEEVHAAVKNLDQGIFPKAFCKIYPDYLGGDDDFINVMHADGAGTKSILAYLYWKETGDVSVWKGIAQDAVVMNLDDLLCVGIYDNIIFNSTIDRNKNLITAEVLEQVINGTQNFFDLMKSFGINIHYLGGETADVGDVVRTIAVNGTMTTRWPKSKIISNENIKPGNVIVGLASFGQSTYENTYNSGIGSNGLTSARHDMLNKYYAHNYKESYDNSLSDDVVYIGKNKIADIKQILSPTRTYAPLIKKLLQNNFDKIHGLIHCSGGGQTKCLKYIPENVRVIKDNLFEPPPIFKAIQEASGADDREMYQVFNMGCRMEIYTDENFAETIIAGAASFNIDAQIIGRVEASDKKTLVIKNKSGELTF
ncbi:phosphoribosylformylglycinamidine cyclo-ligase [Ginsengibacter hankyongi]|uniref:Phosphoribosylformylglycinamidine cyclo-ligase n=1 Tax=Ginsengibacter hankyongi TaxID=2607284 RepID=A0A5J5IG17_9BACT|nr:AIR synthase-related protein [Ginsengibacter hankyongi]KAA9038604.1 phosphoribosylformylglycinamidine cyclo-ligase [Ginsengibacter hankyongi]